MKEKKEALKLIEETLIELESPNGSVLTAIQKLARVTLILDNKNIYIWCQIQLGDNLYIQPLKKLINLHKKYRKERSNELIQAIKKQMKVLSKLKLKEEIHYKREEFNLKSNKSGGGYQNIGMIETIYTRFIQEKIGNDGIHYRNNLDIHLNYVKNTAHKTASKLFNEIKFAGTVSNSFDILKNAVDDRLLDLDPKISEQLMLAFKSVSSNKKEEWSEALTSCRRLLESLADKLLPASEEKVNGRILKQGQYVNRLWAFMDKSIESNSNKDLAKTHINFLGSWLEKVNKLANKGVHAELNQLEAVKAVFHTYLVVADILEYLDKKESKPSKFSINKASLDELEVHLDISRTVAKEIFKTRTQEGYLDIDILSKIKGVGKKTLEKAKIEFLIED